MLKKLIASLDDVEEKFRGLYTEQEDGTFKLDIQVEGLEDVTGLKANSKKLKEEKIRLQEELDTLNQKMSDADEDGLEAKGEYEKLLGIKKQQFDADLTLANTRADNADIVTIRINPIKAGYSCKNISSLLIFSFMLSG